MSKLPAFQFYPGDWRKDVGVQSLSYHDRGVWWEMLCLMHESERRGLLILNGKSMSEDALARLLGLDKQNLTTTITTLLTNGVASRDEQTGTLMCRRMVRDEKLREIRTQAGKRGGNPVLLKQNSTTGDKQKLTPSSSSSSSKLFAQSVDEQTEATPLKRKDFPAKAKPSPDPRSSEIRTTYQEWFERANGIPAPWDAKEARNLARFLKSNPTISVGQWRNILAHRARSPVSRTASLSTWVSRALAWLEGPADEWGRPISNGTPFATNHSDKRPLHQRIVFTPNPGAMPA
jgi:hypothetical protein